MNPCLCGHPRHEHSIFHNGRCTGNTTEPVIIGTTLTGWQRTPCTCIEYVRDDGTDGPGAYRPPVHRKPQGA